MMMMMVVVVGGGGCTCPMRGGGRAEVRVARHASAGGSERTWLAAVPCRKSSGLGGVGSTTCRRSRSTSSTNSEGKLRSAYSRTHGVHTVTGRACMCAALV